jgi:tRNA 2-thiouridine synthesizing protein A
MKEIKETLNITKSINTCGEVCPMNMVKTKFTLKEMATGEVLEVTMDEGEPVRNVSHSTKEEGHRIIGVERCDGIVKMLIQKGE